jgi:hypothetical protein
MTDLLLPFQSFFSLFVVVVVGTGVWIQGLMLAQADALALEPFYQPLVCLSSVRYPSVVLT